MIDNIEVLCHSCIKISGDKTIYIDPFRIEEEMKDVISKADYEYQGIEFPKEENKMKETVKIEGMMCNHFEATVKKALEALDGVDSAEVSHEKGTAVLSVSKAVADADIQKAVEDKDYKFVGIEK